MKPMEPFERVWTTLNHEEPDRVPLYEGAIEPLDLSQGKAVIHFNPGILLFSTDVLKYSTHSAMKPLRKIIYSSINNKHILNLLKPSVKPVFNVMSKQYQKFGIDLMGFISGFPMILNHERVFSDFKVVNGKTVISPKGEIVTKISENFGAVSRMGFLRTPEDYNKYIDLDIDHPLNYFLVKPGIKAAKGKMALYFTIFGAASFEHLCEMFGFKTLFRLMIKEPNFIKRVVKEFSDFALSSVEQSAERGAKIFYMTNDMGEQGRPILSPRLYRKFFKESEKKFCNKVHEYGGKVIMHSCGNVMELIDDYIDNGIDALHPWQPYSGMDIFEGKVKWGKKITLIGNVSIEDMSIKGNEHKIIDYVKKLMDKVKPGGGFILSSSHSLVPTVKWRNYGAMLWAAKKYGIY